MSNALSLLDDLEHMFARPDPAGITLDAELCVMMAEALREVRAEFLGAVIEAAAQGEPGKIVRLPQRREFVQRYGVNLPLPPRVERFVPFSDGHDGGAA